ncbi:LysR family transcriptional regulator [Planobispora rosea]|uniref:LysR family transcriptional regulator n=1 Tax=Planobispora rosea TaxID=35762 RepID=A0A8J3WG48_PLARO|nr:LysR family transcriptional regulator [Planobispora rosea]GGS94730.1 LysR family transcriptional regulator [Planobispora rosea]GIH87422.1 LysR family transcriptional regulator [Planobispora rosea]
MNLASLDLNLVVALRALLEERSVTRAGLRIGLSQPATSAALARLRRHFSDDLLVRKGNTYELTALGSALREPAASACVMLERLFTSRADFQPAVEQREFTLLSSDYAIAVFGAELARALHAEAPGVRLHFRNLDGRIVEDTGTVLGGVDGVLMPHGVIRGFPAVELYRDEWVCLVADDHPDIGDHITLDDLARLPWAVYRRFFDAPVTRQLSTLGLEPRVEVSVQSFSLLPNLVAGTRRVTLVQRRLAEMLRGLAPVRVLPCPFEAALQEALWWHPVHSQDAAHIWLRERAAEVGRALREQDHPPRG